MTSQILCIFLLILLNININIYFSGIGLNYDTLTNASSIAATFMKSVKCFPSGIKSKAFKCSFCAFVTSYSPNLRRHLKTHTGEKPFKCNLCNKRFSEKSNLKEHFAVHTEEKPYTCSICSKSFSTKRCLKQHFIIHVQSQLMHYNYHYVLYLFDVF